MRGEPTTSHRIDTLRKDERFSTSRVGRRTWEHGYELESELPRTILGRIRTEQVLLIRGAFGVTATR